MCVFVRVGESVWVCVGVWVCVFLPGFINVYPSVYLSFIYPSVHT